MSSYQRERSYVRKFGWWLSAILLQGFCIFLRTCPESLIPKMATSFGVFLYHTLPHRRRTGIENVRMAYGSAMPRQARTLLIKKTLTNISLDMLETTRSYISRDFEAFMAKNISVHGAVHLDNALKKGKGVIAVSAHIGNFPIIAPKLASCGYPFSLIAKDFNNAYLDCAFDCWRERYGVGMIPYKPRRLCAHESVKVLRGNGIVMLLIDQNPRRKYGIPAKFFGYQVPTYGGLSILARRTGAATVPLFIHRNADNTETIEIFPEIHRKEGETQEQDVMDDLTTINRCCEDWIRQYPEQWWWIHRRFRRATKVPELAESSDTHPEHCAGLSFSDEG